MITIELAGQQIFDVENQDITLFWNGTGLDADLSNIRLFNEAKDYLLTLINNGDIFNKIDFKLKINNQTIYNGYISLRNEHDLSGLCDYIEVTVTRELSNKSLEDLADKLTVQGSIINGTVQVIKIPYQLSTIPDRLAVGIAITGILLTTYILQDIIKELSKDIAVATSNPFTINVVVGIIVEIANASVFLVTLVKYINDLIKALIPEVKQCDSINLRYAISSMLTQLGYSLGAYAYDARANVILTRNDAGNFTNYTLRELLHLAKQLTNTNIVINGNVVNFLPKNNQGNAVYVIENYELIKRYLDLSECSSSLLIRFSYDASDLNTTTLSSGNSLQALYNRHGEGRLIELPVARAKRKDELNNVEKIIRAFLKSIDTIINAIIDIINAIINTVNQIVNAANKIIKTINKITGLKIKLFSFSIQQIDKPNFAKDIENRIGNLLTEADTWGVEKLAIVENGKIAAEHQNIVNTQYIYDNYYANNYVYEIFEIKTIVCYHDLPKITDNQFVIFKNKTCQVLELNYNVNSGICEMKLKALYLQDTTVPTIITT